MPSTDTTFILYTLAGILYVLMSAFVARAIIQGRRSQSYRWRRRGQGLLVLYLLTSLLWTLGQAALQQSWISGPGAQLLAQILHYGLLLLSLLFLLLTRSFLQLSGKGWMWALLGGIWIAVVVILNENLLRLPDTLWTGSGWNISRENVALGAMLLGWGVFMGGAAVLTFKAYQDTRQPLHRNRLTLWVVALVLTLAGWVLFLADLGVLGSSLHLLGTASITYLILTHDLPDMRRMARRAASYLLATLLTVLVYTALFLAIQYAFQPKPGYGLLLAGVTLALILAIVVNPLLGWAQQLMDRILSRPQYNPGHMLREYSTSISNILDLERLATVAVGLISEAMEIQRGALFVVHAANGTDFYSLRGVTGMGKDQPPGSLSTASPLVEHLQQQRQPLTQYDIDLLFGLQDIPQAEREWLSSLDMDVYVPIYAKDKWIGMLALGPKVSGDRYFDQDLELLSTLADQTAVALQNARLYDDLRLHSQEEERLNEQLVATNRELVRLDQSKSDFIQIASHELRTPITTVQGYNDLLSELVRQGTVTPQQGEQMTGGIRNAVQRLEEIIRAMLDVSQIDTETLVLEFWPISLASTIDSAVAGWSAALEERKIKLTVEGLTSLPTIIADGKRLKQALSHLVQNAIKFTPDGGRIRISGHLRAQDLPPEDQTVEIVVADTGIGIASDDLERVFEKFYRASDVLLHSSGETKFKGGGPGLGLTVVRGIVEAHGGFVWAESPGRDETKCPGTEFHVVLPVKPKEHEQTGLEAALW